MRGTLALRTCALFGGDVSGSKAGMRLKLESAFSHYCWELSPLSEQAAPRWKDKWGAEEDKHGRLISTSQQEGVYIYVWVLLDVGCECMCVDMNVCKQEKVSGGGSGGGVCMISREIFPQWGLTSLWSWELYCHTVFWQYEEPGTLSSYSRWMDEQSSSRQCWLQHLLRAIG